MLALKNSQSRSSASQAQQNTPSIFAINGKTVPELHRRLHPVAKKILQFLKNAEGQDYVTLTLSPDMMKAFETMSMGVDIRDRICDIANQVASYNQYDAIVDSVKEKQEPTPSSSANIDLRFFTI